MGELILEGVNIYSADVIIKSDKNKTNQTDVYNKIRGLPDVVTVNTVYLPELEKKDTDLVEYSYLIIKIISKGKPEDDFNSVKQMALHGFEDKPKIEGLIQFIIRNKTIKEI